MYVGMYVHSYMYVCTYVDKECNYVCTYNEAIHTYVHMHIWRDIVIIKSRYIVHNTHRLQILQNIGAVFVKMGQYSDAMTSYEHVMSEKPSVKAG